MALDHPAGGVRAGGSADSGDVTARIHPAPGPSSVVVVDDCGVCLAEELLPPLYGRWCPDCGWIELGADPGLLWLYRACPACSGRSVEAA